MALGGIPVETWLASRFINAWGSDRVASQYTPELLEQIAARFSTLENSIKLKVLFSFLGVRKMQLKACESGMRAILQRASTDEDEWVRLLSEILGAFPESQTLRIDLVNQNYQQLIKDISAKLNKSSSTFFPLEYGYLAQPPVPPSAPTAHFKLKKPLEPIIAKKAAPTKPTEPAKKEVHHTLRPPSPLRHPLGRSHDGSGPRVGMLAGMHLPPDKKRKSTAVLELDDLKEMHAQQRMQEELKRKREEDPKNSAAEKIRKQIERHETIKSRQLEREEKKKKKAEETAARKREIEERKAEKEAKKHEKAAAAASMPEAVPSMGALASLATPAMRAEFNAATMLANASEAMTGRPMALPLPLKQSFVPAAGPSGLPTPLSLPLSAPAPTPTPTMAAPSASAAPQPVSISALLEGNKLTSEDREMLTKFLGGDRTNTGTLPTRQVILNEETKQNPTGGAYLEQIVFEVNYTTGQWKKLRRKLKVATESEARDEAAAAAAALAAVAAAAKPAAVPDPTPAAAPTEGPAVPPSSEAPK